jgi:hypothetical protein
MLSPAAYGLQVPAPAAGSASSREAEGSQGSLARSGGSVAAISADPRCSSTGRRSDKQAVDTAVNAPVTSRSACRAERKLRPVSAASACIRQMRYLPPRMEAERVLFGLARWGLDQEEAPPAEKRHAEPPASCLGARALRDPRSPSATRHVAVPGRTVAQPRRCRSSSRSEAGPSERLPRLAL